VETFPAYLLAAASDSGIPGGGPLRLDAVLVWVAGINAGRPRDRQQSTRLLDAPGRSQLMP